VEVNNLKQGKASNGALAKVDQKEKVQWSPNMDVPRKFHRNSIGIQSDIIGRTEKKPKI